MRYPATVALIPVERGLVRRAVAQWRAAYGCAPEWCGQVRLYAGPYPWSDPAVFTGPVYIGPIPADDVDAWPGAEMIDAAVFERAVRLSRVADWEEPWSASYGM